MFEFDGEVLKKLIKRSRADYQMLDRAARMVGFSLPASTISSHVRNVASPTAETLFLYSYLFHVRPESFCKEEPKFPTDQLLNDGFTQWDVDHFEKHCVCSPIQLVELSERLHRTRFPSFLKRSEEPPELIQQSVGH